MSSGSLVSSVSNSIFGTAVAGFGFSLGRDVYRKFKEISHVLLILCIGFSSFTFPFIAASKIFRWYPISKVRWFFAKFLLWMVVYLLGFVITFCFLKMLQSFELIRFSIDFFGVDVSADQAVIIYSFVFVSFFYLLGVVDGIRKRSKRKSIHQIEVDNNRFLEDVGIYETDGSSSFTHIDVDGNWLRLENIGHDFVEFFVVGKRNKRAYIYIDSFGRFSEYTGVISL